jgi:hypothetical protein
MAYASAVALTVQEISRAGKAAQYPMVAPTATHGNKFINDGRTAFRVKNNGAVPTVVTIDCPAVLDGQAVADLTVTIAATGDGNGLDFQDIGPFPVSFNQSDGYIWAVCSVVASVLVSAVRLPKA